MPRHPINTLWCIPGTNEGDRLLAASMVFLFRWALALHPRLHEEVASCPEAPSRRLQLRGSPLEFFHHRKYRPQWPYFQGEARFYLSNAPFFIDRKSYPKACTHKPDITPKVVNRVHTYKSDRLRRVGPCGTWNRVAAEHYLKRQNSQNSSFNANSDPTM